MERIKYYLVLIANPLTASISSKIVFNLITRLDILSRDVTIFLPGFCSEKDLQKCKDNKRIADSLADYHGNTPLLLHTASLRVICTFMMLCLRGL